MPPRSQRSAAKLPPLRASKLVAAALVMAACLYNSRSPNLLDPGAGDRPADEWVGRRHVTWGLAAMALSQVWLPAWYLRGATSPARLPWTAAEAAAAAACLGGAALRHWCFQTLGRLFTYEVGIRAGHALVGAGPYALLLHPSYAGTGLLVAGASYFLAGPRLLARRPLCILAALAIGAAVAVARISNEERVLEEHFGEAWRAHAAERWRLVPYVF